jgi:clumping factor A
MHRTTSTRSASDTATQERKRARRAGIAAAVLLTAATLPSAVYAAPKLRKQVDLHGNFVLLGATLSQECAAGVPAPVVGTIGSCPDSNLAAPDIYWRSDDPSAGTARADANVSAADARATAVLLLPAGATVAYARLYWGGSLPSNNPDQQIQLERVQDGLNEVVKADDSVSLAQSGSTAFFYQSTADVTALVQAHGVGPYRISGVDSSLANMQTEAVAAWYMVVFYELAGDPSRNLAIFDGLDYVDSSTSAAVTLSGFVVPAAAFDARLGVVAYEGEDQFTGDALSFNGMALSNAANPADNFFNASRSFLGTPVSNAGDLPQLSGAPLSYSNIDMDVVDVTARVHGGDHSAAIAASSTLDIYVMSAFVTSISTLLPDFTPTTKEVVDLNGGVAAPGDVLEYRITARNQGSDAAIGATVRDAVPAGLSFVPGSLHIESGPNSGDKTDAKGDDQAQYDSKSRTVTARLGRGASASAGGTLEIGESSELRFRVTIDADTRGEISNQGVVVAAGKQGAAEAETPTDADTKVSGQDPTTITVEECEDDKQCKAPTPFCDISSSPRRCVGCANSGQCKDPNLPDCDTKTNTCVCKSGLAMCIDSDGDGISDGGEAELGTDPHDADTDDDGVIDGDELGPDKDTDGDGAINALDPDSDNDGLPDGLELGLDCSHVGTDVSRGHCRADADRGATKTNPLERDTDKGSVSDGSEDWNLDGKIDSGETDPTLGHGADDVRVMDSDKDGLSDDLEHTLHSDPHDADTDNDGLLDGEEADPAFDSDHDGLVSVLDVDSDNDGLFDGTELGKDCSDPATDASKGHCRPDADMGKTVTSPVNADTDGGGVRDGSEDVNLNGVVDGSETDPVKGAGKDDASLKDSDGDHLSDTLEIAIGTNPNDADSDDDGLLDGDEANPTDDHDGDGKINALDPDSDGDMLFDGTELGRSCNDKATDNSRMQCLADADMGASVTSPVNADTDYGGIIDGKEDRNHDGVVSANETNPNNPADDVECATDSDCGPADSGKICIAGACAPGCRGTGGNSCPEGQRCTSTDGKPGTCKRIVTAHFGGGGCKCGVIALDRKDVPSALLVALSILLAGRRRNDRRKRRAPK